MPVVAAARTAQEARRAGDRRRRLRPAQPDRIPTAWADRWRKASGGGAHGTRSGPWTGWFSSGQHRQRGRKGHPPAAGFGAGRVGLAPLACQFVGAQCQIA